MVDDLATTAASLTRNNGVIRPFVFADLRKFVPSWAFQGDGKHESVLSGYASFMLFISAGDSESEVEESKTLSKLAAALGAKEKKKKVYCSIDRLMLG